MVSAPRACGRRAHGRGGRGGGARREASAPPGRARRRGALGREHRPEFLGPDPQARLRSSKGASTAPSEPPPRIACAGPSIEVRAPALPAQRESGGRFRKGGEAPRRGLAAVEGGGHLRGPPLELPRDPPRGGPSPAGRTRAPAPRAPPSA